MDGDLAVRSHVDPPDGVDAALELEGVETSEFVEPLTRVVAARKQASCSEVLGMSAP